MNILRLSQAELAYGEHRILHGVDLSIERGERIGLIGRNGTGKSTLMKIIAGERSLDDGERWVADGMKIASLNQEVPEAAAMTVFEVVAQGLTTDTSGELEEWQTQHKVERMLDLLGLDGSLLMSAGSGGLKRRAMLGQALVDEPDLLLLDEPTNHLDIDAIEALQEFLKSTQTTFVLISHDRAMIDALATRIIELDRGVLTSFPGSFATYLERKAKADAEEAEDNRKFDKVLAQEEKWIRQGIKARRTRNEGRVRRLQALRKERAGRINKQGNAKLKLDDGERSGQIVCRLEDVSFGYDSPLIKGFSTQIMRGDRVAIIGPNGSGKSTLIRLILGELEPQQGQVIRGTRLQIAYFDQQRSTLNTKASVRDNVSEGSDQVTIGGKTKHIAGYLADFLFPPGILRMPVAKLSGGEKNRLLMAKLFAQPANVLVLDEPTNDLDVETLELLEELLTDYPGTVLLVSHDRSFIDAIATSVMVFENGQLNEYVGGYTEWQRQKPTPAKPHAAEKTTSAPVENARTKTKKLSYKLQRELDQLPERIEQLEQQQAELQQAVVASDFYQQADAVVKAKLQELQETSDAIDTAYARWEELSSL